MFSFDVILMDCRMPQMDGYLCTKHIKELSGRTKKIPIIAVTADIMDENRKKCMDCGMSDFLEKPFTFEELNEKLSLWLQKRGIEA
jgi:CheY-like chemotaxis protein